MNKGYSCGAPEWGIMMEVWLWICIGILAVVIVALLLKIHMLKKAAKEIEDAFADRLVTDTNTRIDISSGDRSMRRLADAVNRELGKLRAERLRFQQGDTELKQAVTNISHDLRTPLTAICGYLDLLEEEEKPENVERYVAIIRNRSDMLIRLTEELFRYSVIHSREKELAREPVVINHVLEQSVAAFYTALREHSIIPRIQIPEEKVIRMLDGAALSRVCSNLIHNAIKYSDGDLDVTLEPTGEIMFANSAQGLDEVQAGKLFDRFYTVETARRSTGLGLAIARDLVEQMGGTITAEYEDGRLGIRLFFPDSPRKRE